MACVLSKACYSRMIEGDDEYEAFQIICQLKTLVVIRENEIKIKITYGMNKIIREFNLSVAL